MSALWLDNTQNMAFPPVEQADDNGLLAVGGDLSAQRLINAYQNGIFPWFNREDPILWWSPNPRTILRPEQIKVSKSLNKVIRKQLFTVTFDQEFEKVMQACAAPRNDHLAESDDHTWIHDEMIQAYTELHQLGYAHSVECWHQDKLVGGLYGVAIGKVFFGESMFSLVTNSSKIAFVALCQQLERWGFPLIDCQIYSEHLASLGAVEIPRSDFIKQLETFCTQAHQTSPWQLDADLPTHL